MKIALTGAATGIGAATAACFAREGHEVTAFDITRPTAHVAHWIETDLSDPASIAAALAQAEGPYDALVNNAGLPPRDGQAARILQVNYFGLRTFQTGMLPHLAEGAAIVSTASRAGHAWRENLEEVKALMALDAADLPGFLEERGIDEVRAYNLSKEAVIVATMAETEAMLARGLRSNCVSPAAVDTGILDDFIAAFGPRVGKAMERTGRAGKAEEVAELIAFLASPASGWIKGQDILIDGGLSALATTDALGITD